MKIKPGDRSAKTQNRKWRILYRKMTRRTKVLFRISNIEIGMKPTQCKRQVMPVCITNVFILSVSDNVDDVVPLSAA
jgi:hypothetical protein